ncbi:4'-phosphopantetheinyl transferase superfamily protein [Geotalea sp. SG265]|uniref:4'-phosphopantetheinyl transferase family protein n=1 Tax=Geotalea sp. SG265 TaxID=2922867 RepID=UPI001FAFB814|nr:4'-phosphopantetheinyl transferase superfamily protein [Geotalea sp. SG265]
MTLASGAVHIHFYSLDVEEGELKRLGGLLSPEESARAKRLLNPVVRSRFVAGRGGLRRLLAPYLGKAPESLVFAEGEQGKPYFADAAEHGRLRFNLTHKHGRAALAISGGREVGVDLEELRESIPYLKMAERFFITEESDELLILPPDEQMAAFYRCWTRKEAYLKGLGTGLTRAANTFRVSVLPGELLLDDFQDPALKGRWTLHDIQVPEGYCAALAVEGTPRAFTCFPWT